MEKYVVSRELAQKLKDAGYPQTAKFGWTLPTAEYEPRVFEYGSSFNVEGWLAAPMTDELLEQLPDEINGRYVRLEIRNIGKHTFMPILVEEHLQDRTDYREYHPDYNELALDDSDDPGKTINTRPNALAQLWLYCEEQGHLPTPTKGVQPL